MSKLDLVLANPVPCPQGSLFHSWGGGRDEAPPTSSSASDCQLTKESLGDGGGVGRNLLNPVCCLFALRLIAGKTP